MKRIILILAVCLVAGVAYADVMPNPEAGTPFTSQWALTLVTLFAFSIIGGLIVKLSVASLNRALEKKQTAESEHIKRLSEQEKQLAELRLQSARRDLEQDQKIHNLEIKMHECRQQESLMRADFVTRTEHHGDYLRLETQIRDGNEKLLGAVQEIHRRIDEVLVSK